MALRFSAAVFIGLLLFTGCASKPIVVNTPPPFSIAELPIRVGGEPVLMLSQTLSDPKKPEIVEVDILPGRGMNIYQIKANIPGKGVVNLLKSDSLAQASEKMNDGPDDFNGNQSIYSGGAILVPFANRIRGRIKNQGEEKNEIETQIGENIVSLPANWKSKHDEAEPVSIHGLILNRSFAISTESTPEQAMLTGVLTNEDFKGRWPGKLDLAITAALQKNSFTLSVFAKNSGTETVPVGIGWHPLFVFPSGDRAQGRIRVPAKFRLAVNNGDDVFPNGKLLKVEKTPYDFNSLRGKRLGTLSLDDCFTGLDRNSENQAVAEVIDPEARYALRLKAISSEIKAFQVYAPLDTNVVAIEPQYNLTDPFNPIWKENSGIVWLPPGETTKYAVELELFTPSR
jgi:aldose 1-epimerase